MIRILLKKQLQEAFAFLFINKKSGKARSKRSTIIMGVLFLALFVYLGAMIFLMAREICAPLEAVGLGWLYMALMALIAIVLGIFGSVFSTYQTLYKAKDNDLLFSMPIPTKSILAARLLTMYVVGVLYELTVFVPAVIVYFMDAKIGVLGVIFTILIPFILGLLILSLSCVLGYALAVLNAKFKIKSGVAAVLMLAFIALYYYVFYHAQALFAKILASPQEAGEIAKGVLFPLYHMGLATKGDALSMLIFTAILGGIFLLVVFVLSRSFLKLATANVGTAKKVYHEKKANAASLGTALLFKEWKRFSGSTIYFLNAGLSTFLMPILAVLLLVKGGDLVEIVGVLLPAVGTDVLMPFALLIVIMLAGMNSITAPSISLEGRSLWIIRSLPVRTKDILKAKVRLHVLFTAPAALLLILAALIVVRPSVWCWILLPVATVAFVVLSAFFGLAMNLKFTNLTYTNEAQPVKQSMPVAFTLFGSWGYALGIGGIYIAVMDHLAPALYLLIVTGVTALLATSLGFYLAKGGIQKFEEL